MSPIDRSSCRAQSRHAEQCPSTSLGTNGFLVGANFDVLVVGSGAAGLTAALNIAEKCKVAVIAKGALGEGATGWAQGGIAAVL